MSNNNTKNINEEQKLQQSQIPEDDAQQFQEEQQQLTNEEFLKKHANIFFRTTYKQIGERTSSIKPEAGNGIQGKFTDHLLYSGMYRNNGLNTIQDKERYMKGSKDWMDFLN